MPEWFEDWFDSRYYHLLYQQRDDREARFFIDNLIRETNLSKGSRVLDLACGRGRHSVYLNELGFDVVGADLSAASIAHASSAENARLRFVVHDMRKPLDLGEFDLVVNLFTSFGYFDSISENEAVMNSVHGSLSGKGLFALDFLNAEKVVKNLVVAEEKKCGDIRFQITRAVADGHVVKTIRFADAGKQFEFRERVQLLTLQDFRELAKKTGFDELAVFGDYNLGKFVPGNSDRLILIFRKQ
jgi:SAM-dependent methyltransferase